MDDGLHPVRRRFHPDGSVPRIDHAHEPRVSILRCAAVESLDNRAKLGVSVSARKHCRALLDDRLVALLESTRQYPVEHAKQDRSAQREDECVLNSQPERERLAKPFKHGDGKRSRRS